MDALRRAARSRPDAGRPDFLFTRVRRDVDFTMEPRLNAPAVDDHRRGRRRKGAWARRPRYQRMK
jgi:hypothetical protein